MEKWDRRVDALHGSQLCKLYVSAEITIEGRLINDSVMMLTGFLHSPSASSAAESVRRGWVTLSE